MVEGENDHLDESRLPRDRFSMTYCSGCSTLRWSVTEKTPGTLFA